VSPPNLLCFLLMEIVECAECCIHLCMNVASLWKYSIAHVLLGLF
jgi:hypothetical protein